MRPLKMIQTSVAVAAASSLIACSTPKATVYYHSGSSDGKGYDFVLPRTVLKIANSADPKPAGGDSKPGNADPKPAPNPAPKALGSNNLAFTTVPLITDSNGQNLPRFWVSDDSSSGAKLTTTSINTATYADNLILSAFGTQVTDNRGAAIDAGISILGLVASVAGLGFAGGTPDDCKTPPPMPTFLIESFDAVKGAFVPGTKCWGYTITVLHEEKDIDPYAHPIAEIPLNQETAWFPYPACRAVSIAIYPCDPNSGNTCDIAAKQNPTIQTANVAVGTQYRRIPLPYKGKISLHTDFCGVDITNDSSGAQSSWALLKQAISDYNNLKQQKK
jgi:hypothetical protein